jgi:hypothetical protein
MTSVQDETIMAPTPAGSGWTAGRVLTLVAGSMLLLVSLALLTGSGTLIWADQFRSGYLTTSTTRYSTSGYALASEPVDLRGEWAWLGLLIDHVQIRVSPATPADPARPVFVGIAAAGDVQRYLTGVRYTRVGGLIGHDVTNHPGTAVPAAPASALPWAAHVAGTGNLTLTWTARDGAWMVVVMNSDASPGVTVRADAGVSSPALPWLATEMLAAGLLLGVAAVVLIIVPARLAGRPAAAWWLRPRV